MTTVRKEKGQIAQEAIDCYYFVFLAGIPP